MTHGPIFTALQGLAHGFSRAVRPYAKMKPPMRRKALLEAPEHRFLLSVDLVLPLPPPAARDGTDAVGTATATSADAAVATSVVSRMSKVNGTGTTVLSTGGALSLSSVNNRTVSTVADGTAGGASAAGASVAIAAVTGDRQAYADGGVAVTGGSINNNIAAKGRSRVLDKVLNEYEGCDGEMTSWEDVPTCRYGKGIPPLKGIGPH